MKHPITKILLLCPVFLLYTFMLQAQSNLSADGYVHQIDPNGHFLFQGEKQDYIIPADATGLIEFVMEGGDGGIFFGDNTCRADGGDGAKVTMVFLIGNDFTSLNPGGKIRFIVGKKGADLSEDIDGGAGGGGGTAVLYLKPGVTPTSSTPSTVFADQDTHWILLGVAGGGGGAEGVYDSDNPTCSKHAGGAASAGISGTSGGGDNDGGTNGNGGVTDSNGNGGSGGAGGGYLTAGNQDTDSAKNGGAGGISGGFGGNGSSGPSGGYGYGGGGAGNYGENGGGGGGGGYSGGGGGNNGNFYANNGGGGGSYVHPSDVDDFREIVSQGNTGNPKNGYVKYVFRGYGPTARCKDVTVTLENGSYTLTGSEVDNNSVVAPGEGKTTGFAVGFGPSQHFESSISFDCTNIGLYTPVFRVLSANGLYDDCNFAVTVLDDVAPVVACKTGPLEVSVGLNQPYALSVSELEQGWSDGCGIVVYKSLSPSEFTCEDVGSNTVTLTVRDNGGNTGSCTRTVNVVEEFSGIVSLTCPPDIDVNVGPGNCAIQIESGLEPADMNGPCSSTFAYILTKMTPGGNTVADQGSGILSARVFSPGSYKLLYGLYPGNSSPAICAFNITVRYNTPPHAVCNNVTVQLDANGDGAVAASAVGNGTLDGCGIQSLTLDRTEFTCADIGANTVTLTVTDNNGNTSSCTASVTVEDNIPPVVNCQDITVQLNSEGIGSTNPAFNGALGSRSDNCGMDNSISYTGPIFYTCNEIGPAFPITVTLGDVNGNETPCTYMVTVEDNVAPTALCRDVTVQLDANGNGATTAADVDNGSGDACGVQSAVLSRQSFSCGDVGANTVTLTVTDNNGNTSSCTASVTVEDNIPPVVNCQDITVQLNSEGIGSTNPAFNGALGSRSDNCGMDNSISYTGPIFYTCNEIGPAFPITVTLGDVNGNETPCTYMVTVEDNVAPTALCRDVTVELDENGTGSTTAAAVDNGSGDACGVQSAVLSRQSFSCGDVGANTVTLTVTDVNNNTSTCTATVTVEDNVNPTALCRDVTVQLDENGTGSTTAAAVDNGSGDACGVQSAILSRQSFSCGDVGVNTVTLTVTDVNNNTSTCPATVTVEDNVSPVALCNDITVLLDNEGQGEITAQQVDNGSSDVCGIQSLELNQTKFGCDQVGAVEVTLVVTDLNGNVSTCSATVTVTDHAAPVALCRNVTVQLDENGDGSTTAEAVDNGSGDACGIQSAVLSRQSFSCGDVGANTVTLTVTDVNDNASTCAATVTVEDKVAPDAVCRNVTVQLDANGNGATTAADVDNGSGDACGVQSAVLSGQSFSCGDVGANSVTLTVTDVNNNTSTCSAIVTVEDNLDPEVDCSDITVTFNGEGSIRLDPEGMATGTDNCAVTGFEADPPSISCDALGEIVPVTVTVQVASGNTASCTSYVTVEGLPCGWMSMPDGIGCTNGNEGDFDLDAGNFTLMAAGCYTPGASADESGYIKYQLCGDGSITAHIAGLTLPGYAGIVMRESDDPGAKKVAMVYQGVNAVARYVRYTTNGASYPSYINTPGSRWLRIVRTGNIFRGYHSANGITWTYAFAVSVPMNNCIQVGLLAWGTSSGSAVTATFDHVVVDPPYSMDLARSTDTALPVRIGSDASPISAAVWPNPSSGVFNLELDGSGNGEVAVDILDEMARRVAHEQIDPATGNLVRFDLSNRPPGVYHIRLWGKDGSVSVKRIVIIKD